MPTTDTTIATDDTAVRDESGRGAQGMQDKPVELEVLVEEISIDGMCGVY